jgi:hypothetical protein
VFPSSELQGVLSDVLEDAGNELGALARLTLQRAQVQWHELDEHLSWCAECIEALAANGIKVHCLALGGVDLTSAAGRMTMQVLAAVAEFERDLLIERTHSGIARAKAEGKTFGRPSALTADEQAQATL